MLKHFQKEPLLYGQLVGGGAGAGGSSLSGHPPPQSQVLLLEGGSDGPGSIIHIPILPHGRTDCNLQKRKAAGEEGRVEVEEGKGRKEGKQGKKRTDCHKSRQ